MSGDRDLELLTARKILEMQRKLAAAQKRPVEPAKPAKTPRQVVVEQLVERGLEVLEAAEAAYPRETAVLIAQLARLLERGTLRGAIRGGDLLQLFRSLGMRVSVPTTIKIAKDGKLVPLADRLRLDRG